MSLCFLLIGCGSDEEETDSGPDEPDTVDETTAETDETTGSDSGINQPDADSGETQTGGKGLEFLSDFELSGLSGQIDVHFDESGVLHIDCQTDRDCFKAQGYFHAYFRFFQMDLIRRQITGRLSEVVGKTSLSSDKANRHLMTTRSGEPLEEAYFNELDSETKSIFEAYAAGVNAWIDDMEQGKNGASLTEEYESPLVASDNILEWKPEDSIALYLTLAERLGNNSSTEIMNGRAFDQLEESVAADLFTPRPGIESHIMDVSGNETQSLRPPSNHKPFDLKKARQISQRLEGTTPLLERAGDKMSWLESLVLGPESDLEGSNNWVVGPGKTESGNALLANDPHLTIQNPSIWYYVELDSKTNGEGSLHTAGASVASVPGVVVGQNEEVAWGVTTARMDLTDVYVEQLTEDGTAVMHDGEEVEIVTKEFTFDVKGQDSVTETFEWVPHHGPILSKDVENQRAISLKWVLHEPGNDIRFLYDLMKSQNVDEAMESVESVRAINQSFVFIDSDNNFAWYPHTGVPKRPWASSETPNWLPLPADGSAEWQGEVSDENLPKLKNPAGGYIATANNDMDGSYFDADPTNDGHTPWQDSVAYGARHARISNLLEADDNHTLETMAQIQADTKILHAEQILPEILEVLDGENVSLNSEAQAVFEVLEDWEYTCPTGLQGHDPEEASKTSNGTESIGCSAFHVMLPTLTRSIFRDEVAPLENPPHWSHFQVPLKELFTNPETLNRGEAYFDDVSTSETEETKIQILVSTLEETASQLQTNFSSQSQDDWRWGRIHTVSQNSLFASAGITAFNHGPFASDGGMYSVDVAPPSGVDGDFSHSHGASLRVGFEATEDGIRGEFQLPGGQDHHRDSRWYGSLMPKWLEDEPTRMLFERPEVEQNAEISLTIKPE